MYRSHTYSYSSKMHNKLFGNRGRSSDVTNAWINGEIREFDLDFAMRASFPSISHWNAVMCYVLPLKSSFLPDIKFLEKFFQGCDECFGEVHIDVYQKWKRALPVNRNFCREDFGIEWGTYGFHIICNDYKGLLWVFDAL